MAVDWIGLGYAAVIALGGFMGYRRKGSVMSLMAGLVFGGLSAYGALKITMDVQDTSLSLQFLCKECPRVHIHFERVDMKEVPPEPLFFRRWLHERFEIKDRLLTSFYESEDADKKSRFPGEGRCSPLSITKTLPSMIILGGLTLPLLMTESGRNLYVKTWVYGTLLGWLWVNVSP
ncbi:unnamed protein product [Merluccius merluccius]